MASKLCCTMDQDDGRTGSPDLPARISDGTPAKRPLIPKKSPSSSSRFTSARSEDLHELRQIFDNAKDGGPKEFPPAKIPRTRFSRPSFHSLHSLHRIKSVRNLIKRRQSKDLSPTTSGTHLNHNGKRKQNSLGEPDTVVKAPREGPNLQLKLTKDDLRKDLLSDKKPNEGGYDSDAEVLDDIAKDIGKRTPSKRPSIHSIDWTPSNGSKQVTPGSIKVPNPTDVSADSRPYQIETSNSTPKSQIPSRFSYFTFSSSPNLRIDKAKTKERKLGRSHSAVSLEPPAPSPLSPLQPIELLSLSSKDAVPWATTMVESFRLSQFPVPPSSPNTKSPKPSLAGKHLESQAKISTRGTTAERSDLVEMASNSEVRTGSDQVQRCVTVTHGAHQPVEPQDYAPDGLDAEEDPRRSVHLYNMRISHHLRSGSLLSWDQLADAPDIPALPQPLTQRNTSNSSTLLPPLSHRLSISTKLVETEVQATQQQSLGHSRIDRQSSSSGFASSRVPSKWGRVLNDYPAGQDRGQQEEMSSIYSSRPQSPPESFIASMGNLSLKATDAEGSKTSLATSTCAVQADSLPLDSAPQKQDVVATAGLKVDFRATDTRNNSVIKTKKSKFREEFSPPPRKQPIPSASFMRLFRNRTSVRSRSETILNSLKVDGYFDNHIKSPKSREHRLSKSMTSLQTEQKALGKDTEVSPMWEQALKVYQEERSSFFLPQNKNLAVQSRFRERSGSTARPKSVHSADILPPTPGPPDELMAPPTGIGKRLCLPVPPSPIKPDFQLKPIVRRRSAILHPDQDELSPGGAVQNAFNKQSDNTATVGAWGRYPSHSRNERTASAGNSDEVQTRDFALESAIKFAMGEDADVDPVTRIESPTPPGSKKRKKRIGSGRMAKSNSMTFGKTFLKNYAKIFRSQSTEFQRHGHGHRSSVATGGMLEYPELEILPEVWRRQIAEELAGETDDAHPDVSSSAAQGKGKDRADDSMATLRPQENSSEGNNGDSRLCLDGVADINPDRARVWSVYYENCIPNFPRASADVFPSASNTDFSLSMQDFNLARFSFESKHASRHSMTLPTRFKHDRDESRSSRRSALSGASVVPSFVSMRDGNDDGVEGRSVASVRKSTLDLIQRYREQEVVERDRVLSMARESPMGERRGNAAL